MKKTKEAKRRENKKEPEIKIYEHTKSIANTNWWVSQLKRVFFLESRWREWVFFSFFFFLPIVTCLFFLFSTFCYLFFCILLLIYWENQCLSLSLSTFQVINMGFLNEMWYKDLIQRILGCGDFFFSELKIWWFDWTSCPFSLFTLWEIVRNNLFLLNFRLRA